MTTPSTEPSKLWIVLDLNGCHKVIEETRRTGTTERGVWMEVDRNLQEVHDTLEDTERYAVDWVGDIVWDFNG